MFPVAFFDPPTVLDASVTNIPANTSSPLQVISDSGFNMIYAVDFLDSTGSYIGVYVGPLGSELLRTVIGNGLASREWCTIPQHSRVSIRSMTPDAITNGRLSCTFVGV